MLARWKKVQSYQCIYSAQTFHEGKSTQTRMRYFFQSPNKIRMEIEKPKKGAVLIYNPEISKKVRIRPFRKTPFLVLNYNLTDKRVSSDSGGTIDRSDLGHRIESLCDSFGAGDRMEKNEMLLRSEENGKKINRRYTFADQFLRKIEVMDERGRLIELFEWENLEVNPNLNSKLFENF